MGQIINGREAAKAIKEEIKNFVEERIKNNKSIPKIASILVGSDGGSIYYMNNQEKVATSLGLLFEKIVLKETKEESELIDLIEKLNKDKSVSGIIMQLPLPKHINEKRVVSYIDESKDIDCLTVASQGKLYMGDEGFIPCTPNSVVTLLKMLNINLSGKEAVVVGRSNIVGKPAAQLLLNENCTVTICHSRTKNLEEVCKRADILVAAIGKPKFINENFIKEGAIVIDVGTSSVDGKICGDVDFDRVIEKASFVTPVPGGVGALTTTLLIKNACEALKRNED